MCVVCTHHCAAGESVRKIIERVFGMLKKRVRILRLVKKMSEVEQIVQVCCVLHNMFVQVSAFAVCPPTCHALCH